MLASLLTRKVLDLLILRKMECFRIITNLHIFSKDGGLIEYMRISIVVPTHNRKELLNTTIHYLLKQEQKDFLEIEIIIVDDSSTDGTSELVHDYQARTDNLVYVFHSRTELKSCCPASVRNRGIQQSSGEIVVFLDCGVLVPPCFAWRIAERYFALRDQVLIHSIVGLSTSPNEYNQQKLRALSPETLFQDIQCLAQDPEWIDEREGLFDLVNDQLDRLPAPWTLAWTCAMSVPKHMLEKVDGFDETFQNWGGEDTDLGFRLYQSGASFVATRDCVALHLPHEKLPLSERFVTNRENRKKTHKKVYLFDTELHCYYPGIYYNQVLAYYKQLVTMNTVPLYTSETLAVIKNTLLKHDMLSLLIGTDCKFVAERLPTTHNFAYNVAAFKKFCTYFPEREIHYLLGCDTPYEEKYFHTIVLTDFVRLLPKGIQNSLFQELHRIGQNIFCLYTAGYIAPSHQFDGCQWSSLTEITHLLEAAQLRVILVKEINGTSIVKIQSDF